MAVYDECGTCKGYGYKSCTACICTLCNEKGTIACISRRCRQGQESCTFCSGTGYVKTKFLGLITVNSTCRECNGVGTIRCATCGGKSAVTCSSCGGSGQIADCANCRGSKRITCSECLGKGKLLSDWGRRLSRMDRVSLQFEYQKRQNRIQQLEIKISRLSREQDEEERERDALREAHPGAYRHAWTEGMWSREISQLEAEVRGLEEEIAAIDSIITEPRT